MVFIFAVGIWWWMSSHSSRTAAAAATPSAVSAAGRRRSNSGRFHGRRRFRTAQLAKVMEDNRLALRAGKGLNRGVHGLFHLAALIAELGRSHVRRDRFRDCRIIE